MKEETLTYLLFIVVPSGIEVRCVGYVSELAIENEYYGDFSYPSPALESKWRIEDLKARLDEIEKGNYGITAHYFMGCQFSKEDLAYTPPEYFSRVSDIIDAIAIAEERLNLFDCIESDNEFETDCLNSEETPGQLTIGDFLRCGSVDLFEEEEFAA